MSKRLLGTHLFISILLAAFMFSCKYDEGPAISFRSKKERVANRWKIDSYREGGSAVYDTIGTFFFEFTKDGVLKEESGEEIGSWDFRNGKEDLVLVYPGKAEGEVFSIEKLKEEEIILTRKETVTQFVNGEITRTTIDVEIMLTPY